MTKALASADTLVAAALALLAALGSYAVSGTFDPIACDEQTGDVFFGADTPRVFANMTDRRSNYFRTTVHPLLPLVVFPPVRFLHTVGQLESISAARAFVAVAAGLWVALLFVLLRRIGCRRVDALVRRPQRRGLGGHGDQLDSGPSRHTGVSSMATNVPHRPAAVLPLRWPHRRGVGVGCGSRHRARCAATRRTPDESGADAARASRRADPVAHATADADLMADPSLRPPSLEGRGSGG